MSQINEYHAAVVRHLPELSSGQMQRWIEDDGQTLRGVLATALCSPNTPIPKEGPFDPIIRVDCTIRPTYPDWMEEVIHPELENTGPAEYNIASVEQWFHPGQKEGTVKGEVIYKYLKKNEMLANCLGFRDLAEIQKKGIIFFRKFFQGRAVFGWKSVVRHRARDLYVPYLCEYGVVVLLCWDWLVSDWGGCRPALRLAN